MCRNSASLRISGLQSSPVFVFVAQGLSAHRARQVISAMPVRYPQSSPFVGLRPSQ